MSAYFYLTTAVLLSGVSGHSSSFHHEAHYTYKAYFNVNTTGIDGVVSVSNGNLGVNLDLSQVDAASLPDNCLDTLTYHAHDKWTHDGSNDRIGSVNCGLSFTGGHYDPRRACGPSSGESSCSHNDGCIDSGDYSCNTSNYALDPYSCEVGDWSGKYGMLSVNNKSISQEHRSVWESDGEDLENRSVVFHCGNPSVRAFCAQFVKVEDTPKKWTHQKSRDAKRGLNIDLGVYGKFDLKIRTNDELKIEVQFADLNVSCFVGNSNVSELEYAVFNDWNSVETSLTGSDCSEEVIGSSWDPTHDCATPWSGSEYCDDKRLCNGTSANAVCAEESIYCPPGALSKVYGAIPTDSADTYVMHGISEGYLPLFDSLIGRSLVFYCEQDWSIALCGVIRANAARRSRPKDSRRTESELNQN